MYMDGHARGGLYENDDRLSALLRLLNKSTSSFVRTQYEATSDDNGDTDEDDDDDDDANDDDDGFDECCG